MNSYQKQRIADVFVPKIGTPKLECGTTVSSVSEVLCHNLTSFWYKFFFVFRVKNKLVVHHRIGVSEVHCCVSDNQFGQYSIPYWIPNGTN